MRNVTRLPEPPQLRHYAERWTNELIDEIDRCKATGDKVSNSFFSKYNKPYVRKRLHNMYNGLCCYCEKRVDQFHIEHRRPKRPYPEETYSWENLHLACAECNNAKDDKFDESEPILDAAVDPIPVHLSYEQMYQYPLTPRGTTTCNHADLNRENLLTWRTKAFWRVYKIIEGMRRNPDNPAHDVAQLELNRLTKDEFGSYVRYLVETWGP